MNLQTIPSEEFLQLSVHLPVVDVRSPGEFIQGHIPGAFNIPLFDNEERAKVGTTYVKIGKDPAIHLGQSIAEIKKEFYLERIRKVAPGNQILIHCWRGGLRSEKIAEFFTEFGYQVWVLEGGYKSYRGFIRRQFSQERPVFILGGYTGSGKTAILNEMAKLENQTIDLEALANHKGSIFGHLGQGNQPTTEQFENNLYAKWAVYDLKKPLWLEHESVSIGHVFLPDTFFRTMLQGILFLVDLPKTYRISRLVEEYSCFDNLTLQALIGHLGNYMGGNRAKQALQALQNRDFEQVASITLEYYDKLYDNSLINRPVRKIVKVPLPAGDVAENARIVLKFAADFRD